MKRSDILVIALVVGVLLITSLAALVVNGQV